MRPTLLLLSAVLAVAAGCSSQPAEPGQPAPTSTPAQAQQPPPGPTAPEAGRPGGGAAEPATPTPVPTPQSPAPSAQPPSPPPAQKPEASKETAKPAASQSPQQPPRPAPPGPILLTGAPMGGVKFEHSVHAVAQAVPCDTCHHPSRPEKPATVAQEACRSCHTRVALPPMKTKLQAAFHNPNASGGLCLDCHKQASGQGKPAPTKCLQCHKKENG